MGGCKERTFDFLTTSPVLHKPISDNYWSNILFNYPPHWSVTQLYADKGKPNFSSGSSNIWQLDKYIDHLVSGLLKEVMG
jgi:hypothetical protein